MDATGHEDLFEWLEGSIKALIDSDPVSAAVVAQRRDGSVLTGYFHADAQDKAIFAHNVNADAMLDIVLGNIDLVQDALDALNDDDESDEE